MMSEDTYRRVQFMKIAIIVGFIVGCLFVAGCGMAKAKVGLGPITAPGTKLLIKTVLKTNWFVSLSIPIIALGAVAMFNSAAKLGMSAIIFGSVNLFMALATARFALWMSIFGLVGSCSAVIFSVLIKNRALKEVVETVEIVKGGLGQKKKEYWDGDLVGKLTQHPTTSKFVKKIKSKLYKNVDKANETKKLEKEN